MSLLFLTPLGGLLALGALAPLAALLAVRRRAGGVRRAVGLPELPAAVLLVPLVALLAAGSLVGLAAAQPVLERTTTRHVRADAQVFVVLDTSRSMLARESTSAPARLDRAKAAAAELRGALRDVPIGVASLTDRVLPHLFPSPAEDVFVATLERAVGIERPPPRGGLATNATSLGALAAVVTHRFFSPEARRRLLVVLTDGESQPVAARSGLGARFRRPPGVETVFVHLWDPDERVYTRGAPEPQYRPDPKARSILDGVATLTGGTVYSERELGAATRRARELLGTGRTVTEGERRSRTALAPYLALTAFLPLALLLWRRDR
jgi:hypothetical protein